ncbi:hypothetical protein V8C86DRAFT_758011 [Haematococcus lacustris]
MMRNCWIRHFCSPCLLPSACAPGHASCTFVCDITCVIVCVLLQMQMRNTKSKGGAACPGGAACLGGAACPGGAACIRGAAPSPASPPWSYPAMPSGHVAWYHVPPAPICGESAMSAPMQQMVQQMGQFSQQLTTM